MQIDKSENSCFINLSENELTIYKIEEVFSAINREFNSCQKIELNLENISECDTSGVQLLLSLKEYASDSEKELNIKFNSHINELINLYNLEAKFK